MNFTFTVHRNTIPGAKLANGSWTGQIGLIKSNRLLKSFKIKSSDTLLDSSSIFDFQEWF